MLLEATGGGGGEFDIFSGILSSQGVVLAVLVVLVLMSLCCWFIIIYKALWFSSLKAASKRFAASSPNSLVSSLPCRKSYCLSSSVLLPRGGIFPFCCRVDGV